MKIASGVFRRHWLRWSLMTKETRPRHLEGLNACRVTTHAFAPFSVDLRAYKLCHERHVGRSLVRTYSRAASRAMFRLTRNVSGSSSVGRWP